MPINPAISLGVKGIELNDPLAQYGKIAAIQNAQQQNALVQMQMEKARREEETTNALNRVYAAAADPRTGEIDYNKLRTGVAQAGLGSQLPGIAKAAGEMKTQQLTQQKSESEIAATRMKEVRNLLPSVNSPEAYAAWRNYTAQQLPGLAPMIPEQYSPEVVQNLMLEADKALEQHFVAQDTGGESRVVSMPKYKQGPAAVVQGSQVQKTMAPGEAARIAAENRRIEQGEQRLELEGRRVDALEARTRDAGMPGVQLSKKELQAREASFPKATTAIKGFEAEADEMISDLERLAKHPGLNNITGVIAGRTPSITAQGRAAQALYDKIIAKGGFQALQDIRNSSPTGGALGSISNQEGQQLKAAFSEINQITDAADLRGAIQRTIQKVQGSKQRVREGYDLTYEYRAPKEAPAAASPNIDALLDKYK